jgi:spore germination protein YaaH
MQPLAFSLRVRVAGVTILASLLLPMTALASDSVSRGFPHALLYVTGSKKSLASLAAHVGSMDIVAPQTYAAKADGTLLGKPNAEIMRITALSGAKMMPLVVNQNFDQDLMHTLLSDLPSQYRLIDSLIREARERGYLGFQYDFEHMYAADKDAYSSFVERSSQQFQAADLELSVAMAPRHSDDPADYGDGSWDNWTGAFDYARIGAAADFVSVMAYDDSKSVGPAAALPWVKSVVDYTLARVPAEKVSLGVPFYFWSWRDATGKRDHVGGYPSVATLLTSGRYTKKGWNDDLGVSYVRYVQGGKRLTAWYEDKKSFQTKLDIVREKNLRGFSAWALGLEDPKVWDVVLAMRSVRTGLASAQ